MNKRYWYEIRTTHTPTSWDVPEVYTTEDKEDAVASFRSFQIRWPNEEFKLFYCREEEIDWGL
jgi:hypothetical protein